MTIRSTSVTQQVVLQRINCLLIYNYMFIKCKLKGWQDENNERDHV